MFFGSSHLDQRYLGDDPTGSAAQSPTDVGSTGSGAGTAPGTVPPGTLIPAPIVTPLPATGIHAFIQAHKPLLTVAVAAAVVFYLLKSGKVKL